MEVTQSSAAQSELPQSIHNGEAESSQRLKIRLYPPSRCRTPMNQCSQYPGMPLALVDKSKGRDL
jgi:hypothetical protein